MTEEGGRVAGRGGGRGSGGHDTTATIETRTMTLTHANGAASLRDI